MTHAFTKKSMIAFLAAMLVLIVGVTVGALISFGNEIELGGEMNDIKSVFDSDYLVQETKRIDNDGYVGALQYTVYYDKTKGDVVPETHGTPIIAYAINTNTVRTGTDSNEVIIKSMLDRGYVVVVLDYLNQSKACHPNLDNSVQNFVYQMKDGRYFPKKSADTDTDKFFPKSGTYKECFVVPSGHNVLLNQVFWEIDKHAVDGSLEKIVENWNGDFKGTKAEKLVKWSVDGTVEGRKKVANASDGSSPVWYNEAGKTDANGVYTKVKYTVAETFTDCVDPDGSPLETELYMHVVYPTHPEKEVPVLSVATSSGYPNTMSRNIESCSHHSGALFQGYAGAVYDYLWFPMARDASFGYYDGNFNTNGAVTGDHMNYALHLYNDKLINTAAMRYLRYLSLSESETYRFDSDKYTVIGLSKGAWFSFLGEAVLQSELADPTVYTTLDSLEDAIDLKLASFTPKRMLDGHHGETRYQAGNTDTYEGGPYVGKDAVEGGQRQPWLTYEGKEILSGVQFTYAANGSQDEDISEGHSPFFVASHMYDDYGAAYGQGVILPNLSRTMNIPSVFFEVALPHTYAFGEDMNYGVDTYVAFFEFLNYYMKDAPAKVLYTNPRNGNGGVAVTDTLTIKFAGEITLSEIEKNVTVALNGNSVSGKWASSYGDTEWTFTPDQPLKGSSKYTITVSAALCGKNGTPLGEEFVSEFNTAFDIATDATVTADADSNAVFTFTAPSGFAGGNKYVIRFVVENDAANIAGIYTADGVKIASVNLKGAGSYEADVTDYVYANAGKTVSLTLKAEKAENIIEAKRNDLTGCTVHNLASAKVVMLDKDGNETTDESKAYATAFRVVIRDNEGSYYNDVFYGNVTTAVTVGNLIGTTNMSRADYGRKFLITLKLFDTIDRTVQLKLNGMTNSTAGTMDHSQNIVNAKTKAGEWVEVTIPYTVYETDYGVRAYQKKSMGIQISPSGDSELPVYIADFTVTEYITGIDLTYAELAEKNDGGAPYKAPVSDTPFAVYNGETLVGEYATWKAAFGAFKSGYTVKLQSNYTLTDSDLYNGFGGFAQINVDLNGYTITCANSKNSLLWLKNTSVSVAKTVITVANGGIVLTDTPLITYGESNASGAGKNFDINLNDVAFTLGDGAMLTEGISASTVNNGSVTNVAVKMNECSMVAGERNRADVGLNLLPAGNGDLTVNYRITGGSITLETQRWVTVQNTANTSEFFAGENGYTAFYLPAPYIPADTSYLITDGFATLTPVTNRDGVVQYKLEKGENSTRYGIIPEAYADAEAYPFVLFKNGIFVGAYTNWRTATQNAENNNKGLDEVGKQVQLLLRRDYQSEEAGWVLNAFNDILLDLGGHTFYNKEVGIDLTGNYSSAPYTSYFTVKNGKLANVRGIAIIDFQYAAGQTEEKPFKVVFENVEIGYAKDKEGKWFGNDLIALIWNNNRNCAGVDAEVILNDCTINLRDNMPEGKTVTVFNVSDGYAKANVSVTVNGGEILTGADTNAVMYKKDSGDSVTVGTGSNGRYPVLKTYGGAALTDNFPTADGKNLHYTLATDGEEYDTYELTVNPLATPYGAISATYADANKYPFALFKDGVFVSGYETWVSAMNGAKSKPGSTIFLRRDETVVKGEAGSITNLNGAITVDLNGYTLATSGAYLLDQYVGTGNMAYAGTITFKNGTLSRGHSVPMIGLNQASGSYDGEKKMTFNFDNVTIKNTNTGSSGILVDCWDNNSLQLVVDFNMNDCTFDFYGSAKNNTMFGAGANKKVSRLTVNINGGKILADNLASYRMFVLGSEDKAYMGKGADGKYTALVTPTATSPVTSTYPTAEGNMYFVEFERNADDATSTYYLRSMTTPYGTVPHATITANPKYLSAIEYPFLLFMDGQFKRVDTTYGLALSHVKDYLFGTGGNGKQAEIFLRRDYQSSSANDANSGFLSQIGGTVIFDLGGNTYTANNYLLDAYARSTTVDGVAVVHPTRITVKNGNIVNNFDYPIVNFNQGTNPTVKVFDFVFEGVTFSDGKGNTDYLILVCWDNGNKLIDASITFNDCVFDLRRMKKTATVLSAGTSNTNTAVDIVINGGKIITADMNSVKLFVIGNEDSFTMGKGADGEYVTLSQPTSANAPTAVYKNAAGSSLSFAAKGLDGSNRLYVLRAAVSTPYGEIPAAYADANEYPYAVFKDGKFLGAYLKWGDKDDSSVNSALEHAKNVINGSVNKDAVVYILVRADRTVTSDEQFNNFSQAGGTYVIDLDGHTLIREHVLFDAHGKITGKEIHDTYTIVKNGTILSKNGAIVELSSAAIGSSYTHPKTFYFTFENVKLGLANGAATTTPVIVGKNGDNAVGVNAEIVFNGCTFDFVTVAPTANTTLVSLAEKSNNVDGKVTFIGCTVNAENMEKTVLFALGENDSAVFTANENGEYISFNLNENAAAPDCDFRNADGDRLTVTGMGGKYTLVAHTCEFEAVVTAPTCTEDGYTTYTCTCGETYVEDIVPATGHAYDNDYDPDCNNCGEIREIESVTSGEVSRKIFWAYENGTLTITGRGKIKNFSAGVTPWSHLANEIKSVVIGEGITYIGSSAFYSCTAIESVELPESLTAMGNYVFYGCSSLKSITIPEAVTEIGKYSFRRSGLETIDFAIGYGWSAGDKEFSIADIISGGYRFISKSYYKQTWVRNTEAAVETIDPNYFVGGIMHTDVIWELTYTDETKTNLKLTIRGNGAMADFGTAGAPWYAYWEQITEIEIQDGVTTVGRCAFYGLKFVRKATVADSVTAIGDYGFYMCRLLKSIELPDGVTIGKDAFVKTGIGEIPTV